MNTIKTLAIKSAAICLGLVLSTSCTNDSPSQDSTEHAEEINEENLSKKGEKDADKLIEIYTANLYEVQSSEQATNRATTNEVKQLATMITNSHTKMTKDLMQLADRKSITLPGELPNDKLRDLDNLKEKSGLDYDKEYLDQMKNKHEDVIDKLEKTAEKANDPEIKQWAGTAIPEMRSHLDMVEATRNSIKDMKSDARTTDGKNNNKKTNKVL